MSASQYDYLVADGPLVETVCLWSTTLPFDFKHLAKRDRPCNIDTQPCY